MNSSGRCLPGGDSLRQTKCRQFSDTQETGISDLHKRDTSRSSHSWTHVHTLLAVSRAYFFQAGMSEWCLRVQRLTSRNLTGRSGAGLRCTFSASCLTPPCREIPLLASLAGFHFPGHPVSSVHLDPAPSAAASPALLDPTVRNESLFSPGKLSARCFQCLKPAANRPSRRADKDLLLH